MKMLTRIIFGIFVVSFISENIKPTYSMNKVNKKRKNKGEEKKEQKKQKNEEVQKIIEDIKNDESFLKEIANEILKREESEVLLKEMLRQKHSQRSYKIWKAIKGETGWAKKKEKIKEDKKTLERVKKVYKIKTEDISATQWDKIKQNMGRPSFILADSDIRKKPLQEAENLIKTQTPKFVIHQSDITHPYSIKFSLTKNKKTGTEYTNTENSKDIYGIYITFNITDIIEALAQSKKETWKNKKTEWRREKKGGKITTLTPSEKID